MDNENIKRLKWYGNIDILRDKHEQGYTEIAFGTGNKGESEEWIAFLWAFYKISGRISTYERKVTELGSHRTKLDYHAKYYGDEFDRHIKENSISLFPKTSLAELISESEQGIE